MSDLLCREDIVPGSGWSRVQPYWDDTTLNAPLVEACRDEDGDWWYRELDTATGEPTMPVPNETTRP